MSHVDQGQQRAACDPSSPARRLTPARRKDQICVYLRGLSATLKAYATERGLTVSDAARRAILTMLETSVVGPVVAARDDLSARGGKAIGVTLWLRRDVAARLRDRASASGLSRSAYVARTIDEVPAPPLAVSTALGMSTEQLAVLCSDLNELLRTLAQGTIPSTPPLEVSVQTLVADVRRHLVVASRLVSELRSARRIPNRQPSKAADPDPRS